MHVMMVRPPQPGEVLQLRGAVPSTALSITWDDYHGTFLGTDGCLATIDVELIRQGELAQWARAWELLCAP